MCSNPIQIEGETIACRKCNECITARKNDWVARAMAEKATSKQSVAIGLTYRDKDTGEKPDAAVVFRYDDVQRFLKRLRSAYERQYQKTGEIRYIVAGEQGSKKGRVHWHMILFADKPIMGLGEWQTLVGKPKIEHEWEKRQLWSMWEHGHVYPQEPNQGAMEYALKYALKDQFNVVKAKGTMRFSKSEHHASGYFRMSKYPPLGQRYVEQKLQDWCRLEAVPTQLQMKVPELKGYWWPKGSLRELMAEGLHHINEKITRTAGRPAPQWNTLMASIGEDDKVAKEWGILTYGTEQEEQADFEKWRSRMAEKNAIKDKYSDKHSIRKRCGSPLVCRACWNGKNKEQRREHRYWLTDQQFEYEASGKKNTFEIWYRIKGQINPHCTLADDEGWRAPFCA